MATPRRRRARGTPSRSTMLPRRNPSRPGMGGANLPRRRPQPTPTGIPGGTPGVVAPNPGIWQLLNQLGLNVPGPFGFNQAQRNALRPEIGRIAQGLGNRSAADVGFQWNPNQGIAGNLGQYERAIGVQPGQVGPLDATQQQQAMFGRAFGYAGGHPGGGGPGPTQAGPGPAFAPRPQPVQPGIPGGGPGPAFVAPAGAPAGPRRRQQGGGGQQGAAPPQRGSQGPYAQWNPQANFQLPGFGQFARGYYGELPQAPSYLTGEGVAQQQAYMNALRNNLAGIQSQYGQIAPQVNQQMGRLGTDYGQAREQLASGYAGTGIFNSGIARQGFQNQVGDFNRQQQDLMQAAQQQVAGLYGQAGQQFGLTQQQLLDLYRQQAAQQAANPYAPY